MLKVMTKVVGGLEVDQNAARLGVADEAFATHHALGLVAQGVPFRDAYRQTGAALARGEIKRPDDLTATLGASKVQGATGDLRLSALEASLRAETSKVEADRQALWTRFTQLESDLEA
jgi:argininosuccinate lyase